MLVIIQVVLLDFGPEYLNLKYPRSLYSTELVNRLTGHFAIKKPVLGSSAPNKPNSNPESSAEIDDDALCLDWYNSDLYLKISKDNFMVAEPFFKEVRHGSSVVSTITGCNSIGCQQGAFPGYRVLVKRQ